jgi:8-oxo-dGTP pyrophosphatase MutT (NUDIX family)/predicted DNA-binding transcriptional regulator AlpA
MRVTDESDLMTTARAAAAVGVARSTLWRWLKLGWVTPHSRTIGGHLRWDLDELRSQIDRMREPSPVEEYVPEPATHPEHQPVVAAIVTSHLGVLAGRRNDGKPPWTFIAGEIEPGESQVDAAVREVKEETGLEVRAGHHEIGRRVHPKTSRLMIYLACSPVEGTDVFVGDEDELAEVRWLSLAEVDQLMPGMFEPVREHLARLIS